MSPAIRIATWNMKQAVAPKKPLGELWGWIESEIDPDVIVLTEAKIPKEGLPDGWNAIWTPGGVGPRRPWGTIVAAREPVLLEVADFPRNAQGADEFRLPYPGTVHTADIVINDEIWASVVGAYGFLHDGKSGFDALDDIAFEAYDAYASGRHRLIVAGDFNLWPCDVFPTLVDEMGFIDLWDEVNTDDLPILERGIGGSRIWTHKNGNSPNAKQQEIDFILVSEELAEDAESIGGGVDDFPDSWEMSDHAPVVLDFVYS